MGCYGLTLHVDLGGLSWYRQAGSHLPVGFSLLHCCLQPHTPHCMVLSHRLELLGFGDRPGFRISSQEKEPFSLCLDLILVILPRSRPFLRGPSNGFPFVQKLVHHIGLIHVSPT